MSKLVHHIVRICRSSYPAVGRLLQRGQLRETQGERLQHDRFDGVLYRPTPGTLASQGPLSDSTFQLGSQTIRAELHRLPAAELVALLDRPGVRVPVDLNALSRALRVSTSAAQALQLLQQVRPCSTPLPPQLVCPTRFVANWQPELTRLARRGQEWFLVLYFDLTVEDLDSQRMVDDVGIDIGLSPLLGAYYVRRDQDIFVEAPVPGHLLALERELRGEDQQLLRRILYAWHRAPLERFLDNLTYTARQIYVEELAYHDLDKSFLHAARDRGLIDWHESWLHQRLQVCGIPYERVWPNGTSRRCHRCPDHPYGQRVGSVFSCPKCGRTMDAHANAARNIALRGAKKRALRRHQGLSC